MKRGTGYTATHARWESGKGKPVGTFRIDRSARPWGPDGGPPLEDAQPAPPAGAAWLAYLRRYAEGATSEPNQNDAYPIGAYGEALGENLDALRRWYARQPAEHRALWDGNPTVEEAYDAAFSNEYPGSFYGGGGDVAIRTAEDWRARRHLLDGARARGELRLGEVWSIQLVGDSTPTRFLILWMPGGVVDPVDPVDPEEPEEPEVPTPKPLSPVPVRVAELRSLIQDVVDAGVPVPPWLRRLYRGALTTGALDLLLEQAVRAKRKLHGEPEEGR